MATYAVDVALAVDLVDEVQPERWLPLSEGLLWPTPRIRIVDSDRLDEISAWAASRIRSHPLSQLDAAATNFRRVLVDLVSVLHFRMDVQGNHYVVEQWYRLSRGKPGHERDVQTGTRMSLSFTT